MTGGVLGTMSLAPSPACDSPSRRGPFFIAPVTVFLLVAGLMGTVLTFLTPPFQVADEPVHFYRAYAISEGQLGSRKLWAHYFGGSLPRSVVAVVDQVSTGLAGHPEKRQDLQLLRNALHTPLQPGERVDVEYTNATIYFPLVYVPQVIGITIARLLEAPPLVSFWAGRLGNLLVSLALTAVALRLMPFQRWAFALLALLPMVMFQRASISADPLTMSACLMLLALSLHFTFAHPAPLRLPHLALLLASAIFVALCKQAYLPLTLVFLLLPVARLGSFKRYALTLAALIAVPALLQLSWSSVVKENFRPTQVVEQVAFTRAHPFRVLGILVKDFGNRLPDFLHQAGGLFGWLDTPVHRGVLLVLAGLLLLTLALDRMPAPGVDLRSRAITLGVACVGVLGIQAMLYLAWTPPRSEVVEGVQGRYLLPYFPLLVVALAPPQWRLRAPAWLQPVVIAAFLMLTVGVTLTTVYQRYHGAA